MSNPTYSDWLDFMPDEVTITPWTAHSVSGVPTYGGTPRTHPARIEMKNHLCIDASGREILARGRVFMGTTTIPSVKDKITLPAEYVPVSPPIISVNPISDETGIHHITIEIG